MKEYFNIYKYTSAPTYPWVYYYRKLGPKVITQIVTCNFQQLLELQHCYMQNTMDTKAS